MAPYAKACTSPSFLQAQKKISLPRYSTIFHQFSDKCLQNNHKSSFLKVNEILNDTISLKESAFVGGRQITSCKLGGGIHQENKSEGADP